MKHKVSELNWDALIGVGLVLLPWLVGVAVGYLWCL